MEKINKFLDDEKRFCSKCSWNDCDYGCVCPMNEEVYQCDLYMHYHPEEVAEFENSMIEYAKQLREKTLKENLTQEVKAYITTDEIVLNERNNK